MSITKSQIIIVRSIIAKLGLDKDEVIYNLTQGKTTHVSHLSFNQAENLITYLRGTTAPPDRQNVLRRKVLSLCHEMHMHLPNSSKIDMSRVDSLVVKYGYLHKPLNDYTTAELPKLITQVQRIRDSYIKKHKPA